MAVTGFSAILLLLGVPAQTLLAQVNVPTWRYDNTHQGQNTQETILTPTNVNTNTFGKLFSQPVDGQVYAQPLYVANLTIGGATHNVIFVATEHDSVYAFDADTNGGANSAPLWQASLSSTAHGAGAGATTVPTADVQSGTGDIHPEIGITGTPVIDLATQTLFVLAKTKENGTYFQRLHALNILNGSERGGSPVALSASAPNGSNGSSGGSLAFSVLWQNNRVALDLYNGNIYLGFGSHGDDGPWHGWVLVYNETTLAQTAAICTSPNGNGDGVWGAGAAFPIDTVTGSAFLATGNGDYAPAQSPSTITDYGESILRYDLSNGGFTLKDAFIPFNQSSLTGADLDQGSGGILMLPDQPGTYPHLLVQVGKEGRILVLNRDKLNGYAGSGAGSNTNAVQDIVGALQSDSGLWSTPAYWNGNVYMWASNDTLKMFPLSNGALATRPSSQSSTTSSFPGATPVVSSNGTQNGIVWAVRSDRYTSNGSSILYAFNPANVGQEYYDSAQKTSDDAGQAVKFVVPVVTNGKVYVGAGGQVDVYGLLNGAPQAPAPVISPSGGAYTAAQQITIADSVSGAAIYYTTNGATPTASSTKYAGSFQLSANATVQAIASASGYLQSPVASATYAFNTQTPAPQFSPAPGTYTSVQSVTLTDTNSNAIIYYTTDGSAPTTGSKVYSGALTVGSNTVINAMAVSSGLTPSTVTTGSYLIQIPGLSINYANGFASSAGLTLNGSATNVNDTRLQLTTGLTNQTASVFYNTPTNIQAFTTDFAFQLSNAQADGFTFTIQNVTPTAIGGPGGGLGYGPDPTGGTGITGISKSVAIKFDFFNNSGEGNDSTGLYTNGATPTLPAVDMTSSGVLLASGDSMAAHMTYDGANLVLTLTDIVVNKVFTHTWPINIPGTIGSNTAYIGFTGASAGETASQKILNWTLNSNMTTTPQAATPTFSPAAGTYPVAQSVTIADTTPGAVIYYTTNGSSPTTASAVYGSTPIPVGASETLKALVVATGYTQTAATAAYIIQSALAAPTFLPVAGTYATAQSVTLTAAGATIYYTTDGSTPTTSSAQYSAPIPVNSSTTVQAIAVIPGTAQSSVASATYVIQAVAPSSINFAGGFPSATGLQLNGNPSVSANSLAITDGGMNEANSVFWTTPVNIQTFTSNFTFQLTSAVGDGFTFTIQNAGLTAVGSLGGGLGYGSNPGGTTTSIGNSVAVKFDIFDNAGEGSDSTGVYTNGATPTLPAVNLTPSGIRLASGDTMLAQLVYNGTTLTLNLTDTVTGGTFSQGFPINIPATVGGNTAYVGFTGGTGSLTAVQNITTWTFSSSATPTVAEPVFNPAPGTYTTGQNVSLTSTPGATIYYTVDGSTPTHASAIYSGPIVVNGVSLTIRAFASATGSQDSPIVVGAYQLQSAPVATPVISPATGTTFVSTLLVSMADATANSTIYYTTDGTTPTTNSTVYSGAINITASTSFKAIAIANGLPASSVATAAYSLVAAGTGINYGGGFASTAGLSLNGTATNAGGNTLQLTTGVTYQTGSAFTTTPMNIQAFTTDFTFQLVNAQADGMTFTIQNGSAGPAAIGGQGSGLGYGPDTTAGIGTGIPNSVAIKFDFFNNAGEGSNSTGLYVNGASPTVPAVDLTPSGVMLASGDTMAAHITYDGTNLVLTLTDTVTNMVFTHSFAVNIPSTIGGSTAYIGFTGASGGETAVQQILTWTMESGTVTQSATPSFTPAGGTYTSAQSVTLADTTPGAAIYYTTDGTTPNTASRVYGNTAIPVAASSTLKAIAVATGYSQSAVASAAYVIQSAVAATPSFTPAAGTYGSAQSVTIVDTTPGALVYYTTNGVTPTTASAVYGAPIPVAASETLNAIAVATGYTQSAVATAAYVIQSPAATPSFTPAAGTYGSAQSVTIVDTTPGALVYYTTNGVTPTTASAVYGAPIPVAASETLNAIAVAPGYTQSALATAAYVIQSATATPSFTPAAGTYGSAQSVSIVDSTPGAKIYYTTNGSAPTTASAVYGAAIPVTASTTLNAIAVATGYTQSAVASAAYVIQSPTATPSFTPAAGTYGSAQSVSIVDSTPGAKIYYTTNGSAPTTASAVYGAAIPVTASTTLNAIAVATGYTQSGVATAAYVIQSAAATPAFTPAAGTYGSAQSVTIVDSTPGAKIYYTTNGSVPTTASAVYGAAIPVTASTTINAIAVATGYTQSAVATAAYVIQSPTATPTFSPGAGTYFFQQSVSLADATPGAVIYYTTDGSTPTTASAVYSRAIPVAGSFTIKAIAVSTGHAQSTVASAAYVIQSATATPVFTPAGGTYTKAQSVTIADTTPGSRIYYTTDGSTPTTASAVYSGRAIPVTGNATLKAIATASFFYSQSAVATAVYVITSQAATPTFAPTGGTYSSAQSVTLADTTPGAAIYYTTNGAAPTTASTLYTGPIAVSASQTINAIAIAANYGNSAVAAATYSIAATSANTSVNLSGAFNIYGIFNGGTAPTHGGVDLSSSAYAYAGNTLPTGVTLSGAPVTFGPVAAPDAISNAVVALPSGQYSSISVLAASSYGPLLNQPFVVTYSDGTTSTFTQSISDWGNPQNYPGETNVVSDPQRVTPSGALQPGPWYMYGYTFPLNNAKTVSSITLPRRSNVFVFAMTVHQP